MIIKKIIPGQYHIRISFLYNYIRSLFLFGFKKIKKFGLNEEEILYICQKL